MTLKQVEMYYAQLCKSAAFVWRSTERAMTLGLLYQFLTLYVGHHPVYDYSKNPGLFLVALFGSFVIITLIHCYFIAKAEG